MSASRHRIALIHATPVAFQPVIEAFGRLWPEAELCNLLDDSLAPDLERAGHLDAKMIQRFRQLATYVAECGASGVLFTCSAFGPAIEAAGRDLAPMPVLKPNEAMFAEALAVGRRIGMIATFGPSVASMEAEFAAIAAARSGTRIETVCVPEAMRALRSGDGHEHDRLIAEAAGRLEGCDAVLLAQFSTARARDAVGTVVTVPVLTSPDSAVRLLRGRC